MPLLSMWRGEPTIDQPSLARRKNVLVTLIALTSVFPLVFVRPDDAPLAVNVYKYLAKTGALVGSMLLIWQFLLGFRGLVSAVFPDLTWVVELHKKLGQYGVPIILLHPVFIGLYYLERRGLDIYALELDEPFSQLVLLGMVNLGVIALVVLISVFLRQRLGFYPWLYTHLSSYVIPPFLFVHSLLLGPTTQDTPLRYYWWAWALVVAAVLIYRVAHKLGRFGAVYRVVEVEKVGESTTEVVMEAEGHKLVPAPGQFIYLRHAVGDNAHPYTVSTFDVDRGLVGVTVKEEGRQTARLQEAREGEQVLLDGPYGVFTRPARVAGRPLVMVAGGIGVTPFHRLWQELEDTATREAHLFYGNAESSEIVYREELDALTHVNVVHVLSEEPEFEGETGFVTLDVLERHLPQDVTEYQFLICGPPPMISKLETELLDAGVPREQVSHESFAT